MICAVKEDDSLSEWRELPHALYVVFVCAMQLLAVAFAVGLIGALVYFVVAQISSLIT